MLTELEQRADTEARHAHRELVEKLEAKLSKSEALLAKAVEALEPFSEEAAWWFCAGYNASDPVVEAFIDYVGVMTCGDLFRARTTFAELKGETDARILSALSPDTPAPEALVKAAMERAAVSISCACSGGVCEYPAKCPEADAVEIRALASDPETVAQIIEAAKGGR